MANLFGIAKKRWLKNEKILFKALSTSVVKITTNIFIRQFHLQSMPQYFPSCLKVARDKQSSLNCDEIQNEIPEQQLILQQIIKNQRIDLRA